MASTQIRPTPWCSDHLNALKHQVRRKGRASQAARSRVLDPEANRLHVVEQPYLNVAGHYASQVYELAELC